MTQYVVGFLFSEDRKRVALVRKNHPEWQAGRWNGIGGKRGGQEPWKNCMTREFKEEAGVFVSPKLWEHTVTLFNDGFECRFYRAFSDLVDGVQTMETEQVATVWLGLLVELPLINNLRWLIPLQLDTGLVFPFEPIRDELPSGGPLPGSTE